MPATAFRCGWRLGFAFLDRVALIMLVLHVLCADSTPHSYQLRRTACGGSKDRHGDAPRRRAVAGREGRQHPLRTLAARRARTPSSRPHTARGRLRRRVQGGLRTRRAVARPKHRAACKKGPQPCSSQPRGGMLRTAAGSDRWSWRNGAPCHAVPSGWMQLSRALGADQRAARWARDTPLPRQARSNHALRKDAGSSHSAHATATLGLRGVTRPCSCTRHCSPSHGPPPAHRQYQRAAPSKGFVELGRAPGRHRTWRAAAPRRGRLSGRQARKTQGSLPCQVPCALARLRGPGTRQRRGLAGNEGLRSGPGATGCPASRRRWEATGQPRHQWPGLWHTWPCAGRYLSPASALCQRRRAFPRAIKHALGALAPSGPRLEWQAGRPAAEAAKRCAQRGVRCPERRWGVARGAPLQRRVGRVAPRGGRRRVGAARERGKGEGPRRPGARKRAPTLRDAHASACSHRCAAARPGQRGQQGEG
jgi:hypothetical protein